ncbi:MAG: hypothetical protein E5X34_13225 [Mesorhizobium sp.]|uniref:hypothetical protein n=1 Tax=Mesorhizobium sp. TaxID=1871066 RepID=UPI00120E749B|nr:hypothetical protein [Mesorhizobium sp.]TIR24011.1 MAG: hypothetical protein E5X34_13225 [Mesorhizobium sp.]
MTVAYDTLGYAKRLAEAGIKREHAEAHAEAARDFIMSELVTKTDLKAALDAQSLKFALMLGGASLTLFGALTAVIKLI